MHGRVMKHIVAPSWALHEALEMPNLLELVRGLRDRNEMPGRARTTDRPLEPLRRTRTA
jgi:hypothetical protein